MDSLESITPQKALDLYLDQRRREVSQATLRSHKSRLGHFVRWCENNGIDNLNDLTGRKLHEFRLWRRTENGEIAPTTEKTQMDTLRVFMRFCETIDAVENDLSNKVVSPDITLRENSRDVMLGHEEAKATLSKLAKYHYASREHIVMSLLWRTMMRRGAVRALDVQDYDADNLHLHVQHRPDAGTPIKNKDSGERMVAINPDLSELLDDWIADQREDVTDEYGRDPLVTTTQGRISANTINSYVYQWTRPCVYDRQCPVNRDPDDCEAMDSNEASKCPDSVSSHAVRRGSITHHLESDVPTEIVSERANVGPDVIEQHYDQRTERDKMEQRRKYLNNL